ncbi:MAG: hypothetical protein GXY33_04395 [Phycisphaerae bacterium]|nr:hypothetical protein [Phycisphaerae bacterium]
MTIAAIRQAAPRLFRAVDDVDFRYDPPTDPVRRRMLKRLLADCREYEPVVPPARIARRPDSPHPFHQLYITFYEGMRATALIENYSFAYAWTGDRRWLAAAKRWLAAVCRWEHCDAIEEHFYTANRHMHALAVALDLLERELSVAEEQRVVECLAGLMRRWWPEVDGQRDNPAGGHHAIVDNGHFGTAAMALLGRVDEASSWLEAVVHRARAALMPNGCGKDGEACDGVGFWGYENFWRLQLADALLNVTGIDLYREFPATFSRPLRWAGYHVAEYARARRNGEKGEMAIGRREEGLWHVSPALLRLAQMGGDGRLVDLALSDSRLGGLLRFGMGVKGSTAECIVAYGPYAILFCDPKFRARPQAPVGTAHLFRNSANGPQEAVIRRGGLVLIGRFDPKGRGHGCSHTDLYWRGERVFWEIGSRDSQPFGGGTRLAVGGQDESITSVTALRRDGGCDRFRVEGRRTRQEYWVVGDNPPVLVMAARMKDRGVERVAERGGSFVRTDGADYLQYDGGYFNPDAGKLTFGVRLHESMKGNREERILFHAGCGHGCFRGNEFAVGFLGDGRLSFRAVSQQWRVVQASLTKTTLRPGRWYQITARWGGLNDPQGRPFIELSVGDARVRVSGAKAFGMVRPAGAGPMDRPKTFYCRPNTSITFGAAVQVSGTGVACDIREIDLVCVRRKRLRVDFIECLGPETGSGPLVWKLTPPAARRVSGGCATVGGIRQPMVLRAAYPEGLELSREEVPYAPSGFAASSLKWFRQEAFETGTRLLAEAGEAKAVALVVADAKASVEVGAQGNGFEVRVGRRTYHFAVKASGKDVLSLDH